MTRTPIATGMTAALGVALLLTGCSPLASLSSREEVRFGSFPDFAADADPALMSSGVPEDATSINAVFRTDRSGAILAFTSETGPAGCTPGALGDGPDLESTWWPSTEPDDGIICGDWQAFSNESRWYAWTR